MSFFADSDQLYAVAQQLLSQVQKEKPQAAEGITRSRLVVRLRTSGPAAEVTLNGRQRPLQIIYGPAGPRPILDIELAADTLHCILLGELPLKRALGNGALQVRGPAWNVIPLAELFYQGQEFYPQVLADHGLLAGQAGAADQA